MECDTGKMVQKSRVPLCQGLDHLLLTCQHFRKDQFIMRALFGGESEGVICSGIREENEERRQRSQQPRSTVSMTAGGGSRVKVPSGLQHHRHQKGRRGT